MSNIISHKSVNVPLHRQIADALTQRVTNGDLKPGQRLPSERTIALEYSASRATVRTALQHLEQTGLISRRERRSAVVAFRRSAAPSIRIACGSIRLLQLFRRLGELQKLPARFQLHYVDLQQADTVKHLVSHPAESADVLIADLPDLNCLTNRDETNFPIPRSELVDSKFSPILHELFAQNSHCQAVPLGVWPAVVYANQHLLEDSPPLPEPYARWKWNQLTDTLESLKTTPVDYAFQFRSSFDHLSALIESMGDSLYDQQGHLNLNDESQFNPLIRFIYSSLHTNKTTPLLAKAEQVNLFTDQRCSLALDGLNMYPSYRAKLGDQLTVTQLPQAQDTAPEPLYGFGIMVFPEGESSQPSLDLLRSLLSPTTQAVLHQLSGALPVRSDMLTQESLTRMGYPDALASFICAKLANCTLPNAPKQADYKQAVESLFLELWLNLDHTDNIIHRFNQI